MKRMLTFAFALTAIFAILAIAQPLVAAPAPACCNVTAIDSRTGIVTAKEETTGRTFEFRVTNAALLATLHPGSPVYANFKTKQVSLDGKTVCCEIVGIGAAPAAAGAPARPPSTPPAPPAASRPGMVHPGQAAVPMAATLPPVTYGTPQRIQAGMNQTPPVKLGPMGSSTSRVNANVIHLRGADAIKQASNLPEGARNLLLLHVNTLGPDEVDHYVVNTQLAEQWIKAHPALANVKPPTSQNSHAGCKSLSLNCVGEATKHAEGQVSAETQKLLDAGRAEWQHVTKELAHDLQMAEGCFADQTLRLPDIPVEISPGDVPNLTFTMNKNNDPSLHQSTKNQYGSATGEVGGKLTLGLPMDAHFKAEVDMFWIECLPFFIRPKSIQADGTFAMGTKIDAELIATGKFTQEFTVPPSGGPHFPIEMIPIIIAGVPIVELDISVYVDGKLYLDGNGKLDAKFSLETQRQTNEFDFTCNGKGCELNSHGLATKPETTSESVKLDGRIHVKPAIYVALQLDFDIDALTARAGPQPFLEGEVDACGAASGTQTAGGPSTSQESYALTADLDWGIDLRAEALVFNKLVGKPYIKTFPGLVGLHHINFWDLAHSTALLPQVQGLPQASLGQPALYKIKMPSCYPYPDNVTYQLAWTGGARASSSAPGAVVASRSLGKVAPLNLGGKNGGASSSSAAATSCNFQSAQGTCEFDPVKDLELKLVWPAAGTYNLTVTAMGDTPHGREYKSPTPTIVVVTVQ